jgi:hypothetical protein
VLVEVDAKDLVSAAMSRPAIKRLALPTDDGGLNWAENKIRKQLDAEVKSVVQEVVLANAWDFAMKTDSRTSVASTKDYTLNGSSDDALQIYSVDYAGSPIVKKTLAALRDIVSRRTIVSVSYWTVVSRSSGFPVVRLTGTPTEAKTIDYMYWRKDVKLSELPVALDNLLQVALTKRLAPSYENIYPAALASAIAAYERPGADPDTTVMDTAITSANNRRANLHGWGGV